MFNSNASLRNSVTALAALLFLHCPALAQDVTDEFHRVLRHVDIFEMSDPGPSIYDLVVVWEVVAIRPTAAADMTTEVVLSVNGVEVLAQTVPVPLGFKNGIITCGDFDYDVDKWCEGSCPPCGEGLIGVCGRKKVRPGPPPPPPDDDDCPPSECDEPCGEGASGGSQPRIDDCVCTYLISTPFPGLPLTTGDIVAIELRAAPAALPEIATSDDSLSVEIPEAGILPANRFIRPITMGCPVDADGNVTLCHRNLTIHVGAASAGAHLAHGDTCGPCTGRMETLPADPLEFLQALLRQAQEP